MMIIKYGFIIVVFFATSLLSMDNIIPSSSIGLICLPNDIFSKQLKYFLTFQSLGRLKRINKKYNTLVKTKDICPVAHKCCACVCSTKACNIIVKKYDACTKVIRHYAETGNEVMFYHYFQHNINARKITIHRTFNIPLNSPVNIFMNAYIGKYIEPEMLYKINIKRLKSALHNKDIDSSKIIMENVQFNVFTLYSKKKTLLQRICQLKKISLLIALLGGNYSINDTDSVGNSVLHEVIKYGTSEMVQELIQRNIAINIRNKDGLTPLHVAVQYNKYNILLQLLQCKDILINECDNKGYTPLHYAVDNKENRNNEIIQVLICHKSDVNISSLLLVRPLHLAVYLGRYYATTLLLQNGADVNVYDINGRTPLHCAFYIDSQTDKKNIIQLLLKHQANPKIKDNQGRKALKFAKGKYIKKDT